MRTGVVSGNSSRHGMTYHAAKNKVKSSKKASSTSTDDNSKTSITRRKINNAKKTSNVTNNKTKKNSSVINKKSTQINAKAKTNIASLMKKSYSDIKTNSDALEKTATELLDTSDTSLFGKALLKVKTSDDDKDKTAVTQEEYDKNHKALISKITEFVKEYNTEVDSMGKVSGRLNTLYVKRIKSDAGKEMTELKKIGITQSKKGVLSVDEDKLSKVDVKELQKIFGSKNSFAYTIEADAKGISAHATSQINSLSKNIYTSSSNYNKNGTTSSESEQSFSSLG